MYHELIEKTKESARSILPITAFVLILNFTIAKMPLGTIALFITGTILLIVGMGMFTLGSDMALMPIGEIMGAKLTSSKKIWLLVIGSFLLGFLVTIAEPDLQVLTKQVAAIPDNVLILTVACGVGFFLVIAVMRIMLKIKLSFVFIVFYAIIFIMAILGSSDYVAVAFDAGGVTTGPITVPFILAVGAGVSSVNASSKSSEEDSFGLCGICSMGPILSVLILGMIYKTSDSNYAFETPSTADSIWELLGLYSSGFFLFLEEVAIALAPIVIIFLLLQIFILKLPKRQISKICIGMVYTFIGLAIFLTGVNIGFMPAGSTLGANIASLDYNWILIPISIVMGFLVIAAEPAVYALNKQIEEITSGAISKKVMMFGLSASVGISLALSMVRILTGISIWWFLLPGYLIALGLTFFVPQFFTAIAFDSGGVASGAMAAAFMLPFAIGATGAVGGDPMKTAFGIVAMVAMMPLITIQIIGLIYEKKFKDVENEDENIIDEADEDLLNEFYDYSDLVLEGTYSYNEDDEEIVNYVVDDEDKATDLEDSPVLKDNIETNIDNLIKEDIPNDIKVDIEDIPECNENDLKNNIDENNSLDDNKRIYEDKDEDKEN